MMGQAAMSYHDLIDRLFARHSEKSGLVRGEPVQLIYIASKTAEQQGYESEVDIALLTRLFTKAGISPQLIQDTTNI